MIIKRNLLKLTFSYLSLLSFSLASENSMIIENSINEIVAGNRPDRTVPLQVLHRQESFFPYYTSGEGLSCGFRIFGLERDEGVQLLKDNLHRETVKKFVWSAIQNDDRSRIIFSQYFDEIVNDDNNILTYINYFSAQDRELEVQENRNELGMAVTRQHQYGLMDALAYILNKNLYIYTVHNQNMLRLFHSFYISADHSYVHARYQGFHYNILAKTNDLAAQESALVHENNNLAILSQYLYNIPSYPVLPQEIDFETIPENSEINSVINLEIEMGEESIEEYVDPLPISKAQPLQNKVHKSQDSDEDLTLFVPKHNFSEKDFITFLAQQGVKSALRNLTLKESSLACYLHFNEIKNTKTNTALKRASALLGISKLFLEFNFCKPNLTRDQQGEELITELKNFIKIHDQSSQRTMIRLVNYARIFLGKCYVLAKNYKDAYYSFAFVEEGYTKTYLVDMAELIIEHGYRPKRMGDQDPNAFALQLLERANPGQKIKPANNTPPAKRTQSQKSTKELDRIIHPLYVNQTSVQQKISTLSSKSVKLSKAQNTKNGKKSNTQVTSEISNKKRARPNDHLFDNISIKRVKPNTPTVAEPSPKSIESPSIIDNTLPMDIILANTNSFENNEQPSEKEIQDGHYEEETFFILVDERREMCRLHITRGNCLSNEQAFSEFSQALSIAKEMNDLKFQALALFGLGNTHAKNNERAQYYKNMLKIAKKIGDRKLEAKAYIGLANARDGDQAQYYRDALKIAQEIGDQSLETAALIALGNIRDKDEIENYRDALKKAILHKDKKRQAEAHLGLGNVGDGDRSQHYWDALNLAKEINNPKLEAEAHLGLGNTREGDRFQHYREALKIASMLHDPKLEAEAHLGLGNAREGDRFQHYAITLKIAREINDRKLEAKALIGLGNMGDKDRVQHYDKALKIAKEIKDSKLEAEVHIAIGNMGGKDQLQHFDKALTIAQNIKDLKLEAEAHLALGRGRIKNQLQHYLAALKIAQEIKDQRLEAEAHIGLGYSAEGDQTQHYYEALKITQKIGDQKLEAEAHIGLGHARVKDQLQHYYKALKLAQESEEPKLEAEAHLGLGNARVKEEIQHYRDALKIARKIKNQKLIATALIRLGNVVRSRDNQIEYFSKGLEISKDINDHKLEADALVGFGNVYFSLKNNIKSMAYFEKVLMVPNLPEKLSILAKKKIADCQRFMSYSKQGERKKSVIK